MSKPDVPITDYTLVDLLLQAQTVHEEYRAVFGEHGLEKAPKPFASGPANPRQIRDPSEFEMFNCFYSLNVGFVWRETRQVFGDFGGDNFARFESSGDTNPTNIWQKRCAVDSDGFRASAMSRCSTFWPYVPLITGPALRNINDFFFGVCHSLF